MALAAAAGLFACAALPLLAGGCAGKTVTLHNLGDFDEVVLQAKGPVLVDFWKFGCASCMMVDPVMAQLSNEYEGRVVVAKYMLMTFVFGLTSPELRDRYDVTFYPTVILFVDGREKQRWVWKTDPQLYRKALDEIVGRPTTQKDASDKKPSTPKGTGGPGPTTQPGADEGRQTPENH